VYFWVNRPHISVLQHDSLERVETCIHGVDFFHLNCEARLARVGRLNKKPCAWVEVILIMGA